MKKILSVLLSFAILFSMTAISGFSAIAQTNGDWEYSVVDNHATITRYNGRNPEITVPSEIDGLKVDTIGMEAFSYCYFLTSITIPDSVTKIMNSAFLECSNMEIATVPNSVIYIDSTAFTRCISLKDIYYSGSREEWSNIHIDENLNMSENNSLIGVSIHYLSEEYNVTLLPSSLGTAIINGIEAIDTAVTVKLPENSVVTLKAIPVDGAVFTGWSVDGKLISKDADLTVKVFNDITYTPVFQADGTTFTVLFADRYGNIFSSQDVASGADIDFDAVKAPVFAGYTFKGWSVTAEEASKITEPTTIQAIYEKDNSKGYTVTAIGCTITAGDETVTDVLENVPYDTLVTVYKKYTSLWEINKAAVAYGQSYSFYVGSDVTLTTWDGPVVLAPAVAAVSVSEVENGSNIKAAFLATRSISSDCTYVNSGFVYGKNLDNDYITLSDVNSGSAVKAYYCSTDSQQFALTVGIAEQKGKLTARAFLAYIDANGATRVIYAKPQTYTYTENE